MASHENALPTVGLYLVSCVKKKLSRRAPAKKLYASPWFRKVRTIVEATEKPWYILSAKHGLVDPHAVIEPYEKTLNDMSKNERIDWSRKVMHALDPNLADIDSITIFAGEKYREFLESELCGRGITVHVPMKGLRPFGRQLAWLNQQLYR